LRYGLLSDVHANAEALDAALEFLGEEGVDVLLCAGDIVGYGPEPDACVRRLRASAAVCVAGNHELMLLGRLSFDRCTNPLARPSLAYAGRVLTADARAWLSGLPLEAAHGPLVMTHGGIGDPEQYVFDEPAALRQLERLRDIAPDSAVLIVGHTHEPLAVGASSGLRLRGGHGRVALAEDERWLVNPGSVGQTRGAWRARARVAVLDMHAREVTFHALHYDARACRRRLRRAGLDPASHHIRPAPVRTSARAALREVRTAGLGLRRRDS